MPDRNPSPKARFLTSATVTKHHVTVFADERTQFALDMALLQYQRNLCAVTLNPTSDAANFNKLAGAQEFVALLLNLAESPTVPAKSERTDNLTHKV